MKTSTTNNSKALSASVDPVALCMGSSFAVSGPLILHSLWTGDLRYLEGVGPGLIGMAWALGVMLIGFALVIFYGLWRDISAKV